MHHPTDRITHTTAFVTPVVEHWLSEVERSLMVRWVVGSILSWSGPIELFLVSSQCSTTGVTKAVRGMCYPFCGMVHIKDPLLLANG